ncbi:N-acetyl-anhydromuramyl-L-alanine amidase AmpD [Bacillus mesophilus]|nr:N-acetylmuramoyl-L-alanine amidase [Bacillus mesophilus]MBM7662507.1 N-acetyl-anhydromuramyl-L-alanine amidase AmpD [Bacillus mesophilus]
MKVKMIIYVSLILVGVISTGVYIQMQNSAVAKAADTNQHEEEDLGIEVTDIALPEENSKPRVGTISHVVLHFMSNAAVKPNDPYNIEDLTNIFIEYGFSTNYMIARDGTIYRLVPENRTAFHAGPGYLAEFEFYDDILNGYSIGIELLAIGTKEEMTSMIPAKTYNTIDPAHIGYTEAQYESLNNLLDSILKRNPSILPNRDHIIGHDEYAPNRKSDPGSLFDWSKVNAFTQ